VERRGDGTERGRGLAWRAAPLGKGGCSWFLLRRDLQFNPTAGRAIKTALLPLLGVSAVCALRLRLSPRCQRARCEWRGGQWTNQASLSTARPSSGNWVVAVRDAGQGRRRGHAAHWWGRGSARPPPMMPSDYPPDSSSLPQSPLWTAMTATERLESAGSPASPAKQRAGAGSPLSAERKPQSLPTNAKRT